MAKFFTPSKLSENIRETPEGFLLCLGVPLARTGWQEYGPGETPLDVGDDGRVWVYRDPKEVFSPRTMASFLGKSVTIKHPTDFVEPKNWKTLTHGSIQNVRKGAEKDEDGEEMMLADLLITDEMAIGLVTKGLREVSCGYDAEYEETGVGEGKQINIIGNHVALVEQGRAGPTYAIKDHKGKVDPMNLKEMKKQIAALSQTIDSIEDDSDAAAKLAKKKAKTGDKVSDEDMPAFDEMMSMMKDMQEKMADMMKAKDKESPPEKDKPAMEDEEEGGENEMMSRLKALEAAVAKILKGSSEDEDENEEESEDEDESEMSGEDDMEEEETGDEEGEEGEESQKKSKKMGDAALIEILTPGKKFKGDDARKKCLMAFAKTEDGKKVLKQLGMTKPVFDSKSNVSMIFNASAAILKAKRGSGLKGTKDSTGWDTEDEQGFEINGSGGKTAEEINEMNAKIYGNK